METAATLVAIVRRLNPTAFRSASYFVVFARWFPGVIAICKSGSRWSPA
jgi:hypothetical protein